MKSYLGKTLFITYIFFDRLTQLIIITPRQEKYNKTFLWTGRLIFENALRINVSQHLMESSGFILYLSAFRGLNNGVYRAGFARTQEAYETAVKIVFESLDRVILICERRHTVADLHSKILDVRPPLGLIFFMFMQFWENFGRIIG